MTSARNKDQERVIVTGVAGFIGRAMAERLLMEDRQVIGIDLPAGGELRQKRLSTLENHQNFEFHPLDLSNTEEVEALFTSARCKTVYHFAARAGVRESEEIPHAYGRDNLQAFLNVLEGCRKGGVRHLLYASSSSVYGPQAKRPFSEDENIDNPLSLYAATKRANELMAQSYSHLFGFMTTGLRLFTVYGPFGRPDMFMLQAVRAVLEGLSLDIFDGGHLTRDFTYIDDVVEAALRLSRRDAIGEAHIFNIGTGHETRIDTVVRIIEEIAGKTARLTTSHRHPSDAEYTCASTEKLRAAIGFVPAVLPVEGVRRLMAWYGDSQPRHSCESGDGGGGSSALTPPPPVANGCLPPSAYS